MVLSITLTSYKSVCQLVMSRGGLFLCALDLHWICSIHFIWGLLIGLEICNRQFEYNIHGATKGTALWSICSA